MTYATLMFIIDIIMTKLDVELRNAGASLLSTGEAANILGITPLAASRLVRLGKIPGLKVGHFYVISRALVEEMAKTYVPRKGHPRVKRKYTKRSPKWENK